MGEYYRAVNLDKKEYICGSSIGLCILKLSSIVEPPFASLLVWLLAERTYPDDSKWLGSWAKNRIVLAGDEGSAREIYDATKYDFEFTDITIPVFEAYINYNYFSRIEYWELGMIDDTGNLILNDNLRQQLREQRKDMEVPKSLLSFD